MISQSYDDQLLFAQDFQIAKKETRENRIYSIRNHGKALPYGQSTSQISEGKFMKWKNYFEDEEIHEEIEKDVKRTRTEIHFFAKPTDIFLDTLENQARLQR